MQHRINDNVEPDRSSPAREIDGDDAGARVPNEPVEGGLVEEDSPDGLTQTDDIVDDELEDAPAVIEPLPDAEAG